MRTFKQEERGGPSLVDCVSFVAMRDLRVRLAFAYDRHFETAGCRLVRTVGDLSP
jgi:predicted nucleic acid-binding protein